ncbi:hypothetical protein [Nocardiopsis synnemataformans]|uniref:hypothetical protein n=1 Tax=Nocardiopsis synnemataformans TaxID=61305 RepID=UPI003EBDD258
MELREFAPGQGMCPGCGQSVHLLSPRRGDLHMVIAEHQHDSGLCSGSGKAEVGWARSRGAVEWEQMSDADRGVALAHVFECTTPRAPRTAWEHPEHAYHEGPLAGLEPLQVCAHAWDQTGGWPAALERWGTEQVHAWVEERRLTPAEFLARHGFAAGSSLYVVEGRALGVCVGAGGQRPPGWAWWTAATGPGGQSVVRPDGRTRVGRIAVREMSLLRVSEPTRVDAGTEPVQAWQALMQAADRWEPVAVERADGTRVVYHPTAA